MDQQDKQRRKYSLIFLGPFPVGNVSSLRIMSYCKSLVKNGESVKVLILAPTSEAKVNKEKTGVFQGVEYTYLTSITWKENNPLKVVKILYYIIGLFKSLKQIKQYKTTCLLSYHSNLIANIFYWFYTRILKIPFVIDKTEYPYGYIHMSKIRQFFERFKLIFFDGFIVISDELRIFYSLINSNTFLLPMTIDTNRFDGIIKESVTKPYIAVVFGSHNRDGLLDSIISYRTYRDLSGDKSYNLMLIGDIEKLSNKQEILNYIHNNDLIKYIEFKGLVPINEVPRLLVNAECLLTTATKYESGGFPTKLGEYMLSGTPVVATGAGEIPKYVIHNENILLAAPKDYDSLSKSLLLIEKDKIYGKYIADNAKKWAIHVFNADTYINDLIVFLDNTRV